jgi:putative aminopeptidase
MTAIPTNPRRSALSARRSALLLLAMTAAAAGAQQPAEDRAAAAVSAWIHLAAPPGHDAAVAAALSRALTGWTADDNGNLVRRSGSGRPRRVVACALDVSSYVVSQITDGGYLRLRRTGNPGHPLWDQFHEAQRVKVLTASGAVPGVVAVPNGHFAQQHRGDTLALTMDQLWIDVGASSPSEAGFLGIGILDPVVIDRPAWTYAGYAAGPAAGARAGCAAVATAAAGRVRAGETIFVISTQRVFGWAGLAGIMARLGPVDALTVVDVGQPGGNAPFAATNRLGQGQNALTRTARADTVRVLRPRVRFAQSLVESIHTDDARALLTAVAEAAAVAPAGEWVAPPLDSARALGNRSEYNDLERQWMALVDLPGVAGHEHQVRQAVLAALPDWARRIAVVDSMGNVVVAAGPNRDSVAFIAHMDEVGFEVVRILGDGRVELRTRGGAVVPSWEGTPAHLNFDPDASGRIAQPLRGVFVPRDSGRTKSGPSPGQGTTWLTAWFGVDSARLVAQGVRPGLSVTSYKRAARLGGTRVTGRGSDDRSGTTALLFAIRRVHPDSLPRKVFFVWSVQEEGGLNGARYFGDRYGASLRRVYSIDTFVSSDTPLESPHFAYLPLGAGAVLRGLDNGSLVPRAERDRIIQTAAANGIRLQVGTTFGSTDGSAIQIWGPPNIGLSWPGRYSHGPAEVLDLRDVDALSRLITALAKRP